ncbi:MAG: hypothetical protein ACTSUF_09965 [Candidatus Heimdallarchaeaceae archaeon]
MTKIRYTPRYNFFSKEKILPNLALLLVIAAGIFYAFYEQILLMQVLSWIIIAVIATIVITRLVVEVILDQSPSIVNLINEILYLLLGLPYLIIAGLFLPLSIYILFFHPKNAPLTIAFIAIAATVELAAILYVIRKGLKDKELTLGEYIKYVFNFNRRIEEARKIKERAEEIEAFYEKLDRAKATADHKLKARTGGFEEFDWKERLHELSEETIEGIPCWNCKKVNPSDATKCEYCGVSLGVMISKEEVAEKKKQAPTASVRIVHDEKIKPITSHVILLIIGAVLFSINGIINVFDFVQRQYWGNSSVLEYVTFAVMALGLFPIGLSIRWITEDYFKEYITKSGQITQEIFYGYAIVVILNMLLVGFPAMAAVAGIFVIIGRIVGFYMLYRTLEKIKKRTYLNVGGFIYWFYAFYSLIIATIHQIAAFGQDETMKVLLFTFQGVIDSFLSVLVAIKLIIDGLAIRKYLIKMGVKPKGIEDSWIFRDKVADGAIKVKSS